MDLHAAPPGPRDKVDHVRDVPAESRRLHGVCYAPGEAELSGLRDRAPAGAPVTKF